MNAITCEPSRSNVIEFSDKLFLDCNLQLDKGYIGN